jgi:glycosyltransferase involved in cell wall biosynthesis
MSVAVVIPVFNREEELLRAVDSLRNQTWLPTEWIVVDDGSDHGAVNHRSLIENAGGLFLPLPENVGVAGARNAGVAASSSDWIAFLDSDDEWHPRKLELQLAWHSQHPEVRISQVQEQWVRSGKPVRKPSGWEQRGGDLFEIALRQCVIGPSCVLIRRDLWKEVGGFDERFRVCEDYELWLRITRKEKIGLVEDGPLVTKHAGHQDQLSFTTPALDRFRILALLKLLGGGELHEVEHSQVTTMIREKAEIVAQGAEKRGDLSRFALFDTLAKADLTGYRGGPDPLSAGVWREALKSGESSG